MGRTVLPFSQVIRAEMERLKKFRRVLRKEDQEIFDRLFDFAQMQVQTGVYASFSEPMVPILLSILLEQEKRLLALESRLCEHRASKGFLEPEAQPCNEEHSEFPESTDAETGA
jgi:hypothetical protein